MAYQYAMRQKAAAARRTVQPERSGGTQLWNGGAARTEEAGMGRQLDQMMQERIQQHFLDNQRPDAEREADALSVGMGDARSPEEVKARMGEQLGADFSGVRFHTDASAVSTAEQMGARAYATGRDIYFGEGGFDPAVAAHELVHTVQQGQVESAAATVAAPAGQVQMMPKFLKRLFGKKAPKISEPTLVSQGNWGQEIFSEALAQRDSALSAEGADKDAVQQQFVARMNQLSNLQGGGQVQFGKGIYNGIGGAALHQIVLNTSSEALQADTALQDRVVSGFNARMGDELEKRSGGGVSMAKQAFRGNELGEYNAYNDMLKGMIPQEMLSTVYDASRTADPTPVKGVKGSTPEETIPASSHGAPEAVGALADSVQQNAPIMRLLNNSKAAFSRSQELGDAASTSEMLMNNFALRAFGPLFAGMSSDEDLNTMARRGQMFMQEVNTGKSQAAGAYRSALLSPSAPAQAPAPAPAPAPAQAKNGFAQKLEFWRRR